ncbi:MAG: PKD domain-containing protein [Solirubrobacteraceae bacterium]
MRLPSHPRSLAVALIAAALSSFALAATAGAVVQTVGGTPVGLQPRETATVFAGDLKEKLSGEGEFESNLTAATFANPGGSPVVHGNDTYAVYWDPMNQYHGYWQHLINTFLQAVGADSGSLKNVFAVDTQYTDRSNRPAIYSSTFRGAYTDTDPYPAAGNCTDPHPLEVGDAITCLTDQQLREELNNFIVQHHLQTGMGTIFYLLTPPGVTVCLDAGGPLGHCSDYAGPAGGVSYQNSFCSYHSDINPDATPLGDDKTVLYAAIPWTAGGLGDGHLLPGDMKAAFDCQDGGFDPTSKPIEKKEKGKEKTEKEKEEFEVKTVEEKRKIEEAEVREGPHQQEPNQGQCPSRDGYCDAGLPDLIVNQIAVEQQNATTDPLLGSWQDTAGNEVTDECRNFFANGSQGAHSSSGSVTANEETGAGTLANETVGGSGYYLNDTFSFAGLFYGGVPCVGAINLVPEFTAPNPVNAGDVVGFDGMESYVDLNQGVKYSKSGEAQTSYPTFTWSFGDGTPNVSGYAPGAPPANSPATSPCEAPWQAPCAASTFHAYQYGGTYTVTLTVKDVGGNTATVTRPIVVSGPPRPGESTSASAGSAGAAGGAGSSSSPGSSAKSPVLGPVASMAVGSHSLSKTLRGGLIVRYSVNQQATGHFEVLLAASIAHRIGLHPPLAAGLPVGTPPQVVIAKALLITTRAGRGTLKIQFGKITAKRLRRLHNVSLLLRLNVRNAGGGTTTVLSKLTLH